MPYRSAAVWIRNNDGDTVRQADLYNVVTANALPGHNTTLTIPPVEFTIHDINMNRMSIITWHNALSTTTPLTIGSTNTPSYFKLTKIN